MTRFLNICKIPPPCHFWSFDLLTAHEGMNGIDACGLKVCSATATVGGTRESASNLHIGGVGGVVATTPRSCLEHAVTQGSQNISQLFPINSLGNKDIHICWVANSFSSPNRTLSWSWASIILDWQNNLRLNIQTSLAIHCTQSCVDESGDGVWLLCQPDLAGEQAPTRPIHNPLTPLFLEHHQNYVEQDLTHKVFKTALLPISQRPSWICNARHQARSMCDKHHWHLQISSDKSSDQTDTEGRRHQRVLLWWCIEIAINSPTKFHAIC